MTRLVADTSTIVLASQRTNDRDATFSRLLEEHEVVSPMIMAWELGQVVHVKRAEEFGKTLDERTEALATLLGSIELLPIEPMDLLTIGRVCEETGRSFYDASFLEVADRDDATILLTEDADLRRAARRRLGAERAFSLDEASTRL